MIDEEEGGFEITPEMLANSAELVKKLGELEKQPDEETPLPEYHNPVVEAVMQHVCGDEAPLPCLCAQCPAAVWKVSDNKRRIRGGDGALVQSDSMEVKVFCGVTHQDLVKFTPDYAAKALEPSTDGEVVWFCGAFAEQLLNWQTKQG